MVLTASREREREPILDKNYYVDFIVKRTILPAGQVLARPRQKARVLSCQPGAQDEPHSKKERKGFGENIVMILFTCEKMLVQMCFPRRNWPSLIHLPILRRRDQL